MTLVLIWAVGVVIIYGLAYERNLGAGDVAAALVVALCWPLLVLGFLLLVALAAGFYALAWVLDQLGL